MAAPGGVGFFGKLPGMGDFVQRRLPGAFVSAWDARFEGAVSAARAAFAEDWRSLWQTAPVWRFALMPGVCGVTAWVGVTGPSVDRVGRSFPMVLACPLTDADTFGRIVRNGAGWFDALERTCRGADATPTAESFDATVAALPAPVDWLQGAAAACSDATDWTQADVWCMPWQAVAEDRQLAAWLAVCMETDDACLWWTHGNPRVPSCAVLTHGLPRPVDYPAFLDATRAPMDWRTLGVLAAPSPTARVQMPPPAAATPPVLPDDLDDMLAGLLPGSPPAAGGVAAAPDLADASSADSLLDELVGPMPTAVATPPLPATVVTAAVAPDDDPDRTVVPMPDSAAAPAPPPATPVASPQPAAEAAANAGVVFAQVGAVTVLAADNGPSDPRRQAAARAGALLDELGSMADIERWCEQLRALHPALRERSEDLLDPIPEDGAVIVARVVAGDAALLRVGAASAWHWRRGQLRSLFNDASAEVPLDQADTARPDDLSGVLGDARALPTPGLGTAAEPRCDETRCLVTAGDRLLLLATDTLVGVPAQALAAALAATTSDDACAQIATAAGLGTDRLHWPVAVIEVGT
ncbi:MAG TPA: type VI secretion system-associated protein TagF [Rhodanobacteraceae bacterium]|nr:type VI secretion system-associated protein TagF [Rhodanobacteraceae bacterium]